MKLLMVLKFKAYSLIKVNKSFIYVWIHYSTYIAKKGNDSIYSKYIDRYLISRGC